MTEEQWTKTVTVMLSLCIDFYDLGIKKEELSLANTQFVKRSLEIFKTLTNGENNE